MPPIQSQQLEQIRRLLTDNDTYATTLIVLLVDMYGTEAFTWTPSNIAEELYDDYHVTLAPGNLDKIMVMIGLLTTDQFYKNVKCFIRYCNVLAGDLFDPTVFNPAEPDEMAWAITEAMILERPDEDDPFDEEICSYIGKALDEAGFSTAPDILRFAIRDHQDVLDRFDDPADHDAYRGQQDIKARVVNQMVRENLLDLLEQLERLPLVHGNAVDLVSKLKNGVR